MIISAVNTPLMTPTRTTLFMTLLLPLMAPVGLTAQQQGVSVVVARQAGRDGSAIYQYTVVNNSKQGIARFMIGFLFQGDPELDVVPVGWAGEEGIPKGSSSSPAGWRPMVVRQEGSDKIAIEWASADKTVVPPGQTLRGFSVTAVKPSRKYESSHWTVFFASGSVPVTSGVLTMR